MLHERVKPWLKKDFLPLNARQIVCSQKQALSTWSQIQILRLQKHTYHSFATMISPYAATTVFVLFLGHALLAKAEGQAWSRQMVDAFNIADKDPVAFKTVWDDDCSYKVCFAGSPGCSEGDYDEVFSPFMAALKVFRLKANHFESVDEKGGFYKFSAYMETKLGCKALYTGMGYNEVNEVGKITKHISYSEDSHDLMKCVSEYFGSLEDGMAKQDSL